MKSYCRCQYHHHLFYDCETFINGPQPTTEAKLQGALAILPLLAGLRFSLWLRSSWESSNYTQLSISWDIFTSSDHVIKLAWMMMPGLGDAILRPGEVKRPLTAGQFMIQSEVGPPQSRAGQARPHHIPTRRRNGWKPGLQNVELVRPLKIEQWWTNIGTKQN